MNNLRNSIKQYLESPENVVTCHPDDALQSILEKSSSSHDAVFIFDGSRRFLGIVSPYLMLYKKRMKPGLKAKHCTFVPPNIQINDQLPIVAAHMVSTRIYTLPVFDHTLDVCGILRAGTILQRLKHDTAMLSEIARTLNIHIPITVKQTAVVGDIYSLMRQKGISRVIVVNNRGSVSGIVSRSDLKSVFIRPSPRQRFSKLAGDSGHSAYDGEEVYRNDNPIETVSTKQVVTAPDSLSAESIILEMIRFGKNSIVIVNSHGRPTGFLSVRDILESIAGLSLVRQTPIMIRKPDQVPEDEVTRILDLIDRYGNKLNRKQPIRRIEVSFDEVKTARQKPIRFETTLITRFSQGQNLVSSASAESLYASVHQSLKRIEKQQSRIQ